MESLKDTIMRVYHVSNEEAENRIERSKFLLEAGVSPLVVFISEYGDSIDNLVQIITPRSRAA